MTTTLAHRRPVVQPVIVQVNIDISLLFWPLFALAWLGWLGLGRLGRWLRGCGNWWVAAGVVARRRFRRWVRSWKIGLIYSPVLGMG